MSRNNSNEERTLEIPKDTSLPFFAYGIFKPGQLAFSKIKNLIKEDETKNNVKIKYKMKHRDGVPILIDKENDYYLTEGSIITFKEGKEKNAYNIIAKTLLKKLYEWGTIEIEDNEFNVIFGVNPYDGSNEIEDPEQRVNFDGQKDPLFSDALEFIEDNLNSNEFTWEIERLFELQMNYMLLWSAIDRYSCIKYNKRKQSWNNEKFAKEKAFKEGIKKFEDKKHKPVFSTDDNEIHEFDVEDPEETLKYYYTFRCNVVHRGKSMPGDYNKLKTATEELLEIFRDVLDDTFDEI